ncbi:N-acetylmuramoyl-L-alanine amidase [Loigolactobacillus bifermentans]|uniref:N-acetylmuramoyl-L-alanine amidase n=1 Tax=Loigolactobacillus bifermentans DSM 20003 TaxID=1423726 RepID=A0A0R1HA02_9LACO|nr:N-acetylmuramoyl-L-alanine amidase [Loigolactobacillus bifermentans]KRK40884.1 hypothetical protein FC07_GL002637 [Loigolactobacillus bifermentans DSM 20003]QGG59638.1 N-acetylmuramidase [Loigolactobacillus bifermentans]
MTKTKSIKTGAVALAAAFLAAPVVLSVPAHAYTIDYTYAFGAGQGSTLKANNLYIILHDVGTESGAAANANYFDNNWSVSQTYTQFTVGDGGKVYQIGEPGYQAWGAGAYANANAPVQIELGHAQTYAQFKQDYAAYVKLAHDMAVKFGVPLRFNDINGGIITHQFVSDNIWGDHQDPTAYLAKWGVSTAMLGHDVVTGVSSLGGTTSTAPKGVITSAVKPTTSAGLTAETGSFTNGDQQIQAHYSPSLSGQKAGQLPANCTVHYDGYINADGYCWVHYTSYSGDSIYLPVHPTGSANNVWGTFK